MSVDRVLPTSGSTLHNSGVPFTEKYHVSGASGLVQRSRTDKTFLGLIIPVLPVWKQRHYRADWTGYVFYRTTLWVQEQPSLERSRLKVQDLPLPGIAWSPPISCIRPLLSARGLGTCRSRRGDFLSLLPFQREEVAGHPVPWEERLNPKLGWAGGGGGVVSQ